MNCIVNLAAVVGGEKTVSPTDKRLKQQSDFPDIQAPLNLPTVD